MVDIDRDTPGIIAIHWKQPMIKAFLYVISLSLSGELNHLSTNSITIPPNTRVVATTYTFSSISSITSLNKSPNTAAGINPINNFI